MNELYIGLAAIGGVVLLVQVASSFIKKKWFLTGPLIALAIGILLGPVFSLIQPDKWESENSFLLEVTRLTLVFGYMAIALRLPVAYLLKKWKSLAILLGIGMPLMWISTGAVIYFTLGISFSVAMLIAATAASTDPIVASTIVTGGVAKKNLPGRIRHIISGESGSNDGAAYPIVLLPILLFTHPTAEALSQWSLKVMLWQVGFTILLGAVLGYAAAKMLKWFEAKGIAKESSFLGYIVALSLLVIGIARVMNTDGILAAFVAGIAFRMAVGKKSERVEIKIQKAVSKFFYTSQFYSFWPDDALATVAGLRLAWGSDGARRAAFPQDTRLVPAVSIHKAPAQLVRYAVCWVVWPPWCFYDFLCRACPATDKSGGSVGPGKPFGFCLSDCTWLYSHSFHTHV
nr:cation:proton antiporter [Pontibacter pamirensis]